MVDLAQGSAQGIGTGGDGIPDRLGGIESVVGSRFNDSLTGDAANNWLAGGLGDDALLGGDVADTASFANSATGISVDLLLGTADGEGNDRLVSMENVRGSVDADVIRADHGVNRLNGAGGDDVLVGERGHDS